MSAGPGGDGAADSATNDPSRHDPGVDPSTDFQSRPHLDRSSDMTIPGYDTATAIRPDQPLHDPLPYGSGFAAPEPLGFGIAPEPAPARAVEVTERRRGGSPVLAVAGLASLGIAVWAILGAPVITPTLLLAAGLVLAVLVGLVMVLRR